MNVTENDNFNISERMYNMIKIFSYDLLKKVISASLVLCICFSCIPFFKIEVNGTNDEMDIKVFDYNICAYPDPRDIDRMFEIFPSRTIDDYSFDKRAVRLKKLIDKYAPDVITLQEVNYQWFPYLVSEASTRLTDKYAYVGISGNGNRGGVGNARWDLYNLIFYNTEKFELIKSGDFWLSTTPDVPSRNTPASQCMNRTCTWAILRDKQTGIAYFQANTHLTTCSEEYATHQAQVLCEQIEKLSCGLPVIITGDMNVSTVKNGKAYGCFTGFGYADARFESDITKTASTWRSFGYYTTRFLSYTIDHLFVKGSIDMKLYKNLTESFDKNYNIIDDYDSIIANGEKFGYDLSDHIGIYFEGTVRNDFSVWDGKTPTKAPETFVKEGNTYYLNGADALAYFAYTVNEGEPYIGCDINLTTDVNLLNFKWTKIGGTKGIDNPFRGKFDGNGHVVHHLYIDENTERSGFFGYASVAEIRNFGIESGHVKSSDWAVGSICGICTSETVIENCYSKADVTGNRGGIGGILGASWNVCTVRNCYYTGNISCTRTSGASGGDVTLGGIVGFVSASYGEKQVVNINSCYYAGEKKLNANDTVNRIYSGAIYSKIANPSASEPTSTLTVDVSGCLYPENCVISPTSDKRTNTKEETGYISKGTHSNDFNKLNYLNAYTDDINSVNGYYPVLLWQGEKQSVIPNDGTNYYISDKDEFFSFAYDVNTGKNTYEGCNVYLLADMYLENEKFTPIGTSVYPFKGSFNGLGHNIHGLYISEHKDNVGLFGYIDKAVIENLGLASGSVKGDYSVGALVGYMNDGSIIKKCYSRADVFGTTNVGGLIGSAGACTVEDSYVNAYVSGVSFGKALVAGGIVGIAVARDSATSLHIKRSYYVNDYIMASYSASASGDFKGYYVGEIAGGATSDKICVSLDHCASQYTSKNFSSQITNNTQNSNIYLYTGKNALGTDKLNSNGNTNFVEDTSSINDKYPVLYWQVNGKSKEMTDAVISQSGCEYICFENVTVQKGGYVIVAVSVKNTVGITDISFDLEYDGAFKIAEVYGGELSAKNGTGYDIALSGEPTESHTVAYITLYAKDTPEGVYTFTADNITLIGENGAITAFSEAFTVSVEDYILGDANGDEIINGKDMIRIKKHLNGENVKIGTAADIDRDGKFTETDLSLLADMIVHG